jgi:hypothetical protein
VVKSHCQLNISTMPYSTEEVSLIDYINKLTVQGLPPMAPIVRNLVDEIIRRSVRKNWTGQFIKR